MDFRASGPKNTSSHWVQTSAGDVAKDVQLSVPAVDVLDATLFDGAFAEWACCHHENISRLPALVTLA